MEIKEPAPGRALVVGLGAVGLRAAKLLKARRWNVIGTTRSPEKITQLKNMGLDAVLFDLTQPGQARALPLDIDSVLLCPAPDQSDVASYRAIYQDGIINLMSHLSKRPNLKSIVYTSSVGVYGERKGDWVDEETPVEPVTERQKILLSAEQAVLNADVPATALRLAGLYGPERNRLTAVRSGRWDKLGDPNAYVNMIHLDDAASALVFFSSKTSEASVVIGVDHEPVVRQQMTDWLRRRLGLDPIKDETDLEPSPSGAGNKRCSNKKLLKMGYQFIHPTFRDGYEAILSTAPQESSN